MDGPGHGAVRRMRDEGPARWTGRRSVEGAEAEDGATATATGAMCQWEWKAWTGEVEDWTRGAGRRDEQRSE